MNNIINLVSSPAEPDFKRTKVEGDHSILLDDKRIPTPTFNAFRDRWLKGGSGPTIAAGSPTIIKPTLDSVVLIESSEGEEGGRAKGFLKCRIPRASHDNDSPCSLSVPTVQAPLSPESLPQPAKSSRPRLGRPPRLKSEALGEISIVIDGCFKGRYPSELAELANVIPVIEEPQDTENLVLWRRESSRINSPEMSPFALLIFDAKDIYKDIQTGETGCIDRWVQASKSLVPAAYSKINFLIVGGKGLGHKISGQVNKKFRAAVLSGCKLTPTKAAVSQWADLEQQLWISCCETGVHLRFLEKMASLCPFLVEFSKCVAWEPYAAAAQSLTFCATSNRKGGTTLTSTWHKMLEEIGRVTPEVAAAIVSHYPELTSLLTQYDRLEASFGEHLLANISTGRRALGPALSRRIYRILTSHNPSAMANL